MKRWMAMVMGIFAIPLAHQGAAQFRPMYPQDHAPNEWSARCEARGKPVRCDVESFMNADPAVLRKATQVATQQSYDADSRQLSLSCDVAQGGVCHLLVFSGRWRRAATVRVGDTLIIGKVPPTAQLCTAARPITRSCQGMAVRAAAARPQSPAPPPRA